MFLGHSRAQTGCSHDRTGARVPAAVWILPPYRGTVEVLRQLCYFPDSIFYQPVSHI